MTRNAASDPYRRPAVADPVLAGRVAKLVLLMRCRPCATPLDGAGGGHGLRLPRCFPRPTAARYEGQAALWALRRRTFMQRVPLPSYSVRPLLA